MGCIAPLHNNMKTLTPSPKGIYHKQTRLRWHAVAFVGRDGEPFLVAASTAKRAAFIAKTHVPDAEDVVIERVEIRKGAINPRN
jgi:hypothetical protein